MTPTRVVSLFILVALLPAVGCKKNQNDGGFGAAVDGDNVFGTPLPARPDGAGFFGANVDRNAYSPVYFGFDSFSIGGSEFGKIQSVASQMGGGSFTVIIAGFTDERGTEEYNRALGEKRAQAVRDALISEGVSPARLQTVSFGEDEPADPGSGESAWAANRRAEFGVVR